VTLIVDHDPAGALGLAAVHVWGGRALVRWVPAGVGRMAGTLGIVAVPVVLGTAAVILRIPERTSSHRFHWRESLRTARSRAVALFAADV
jgi:hypothetical protein